MRRLCGIRPSGRLHLGHYFSVLKPAKEFGCDILIAVLHAPSADFEDYMGNARYHILQQYGNIKPQANHFPPLFYFRLLELAPVGELQRMTQYKAGDHKNAHLLTYPVLMACDVANYDEVYVGDDQQQHLEFARYLLRKFNAKYPDMQVAIPEAKIVGGRIMDLKDPTKKMSKSDPKSCLFLDDEPKTMREKIMGAVTTTEGLKNLNTLYKEFCGGVGFPDQFCEEGKKVLSEYIIKKFHD